MSFSYFHCWFIFFVFLQLHQMPSQVTRAKLSQESWAFPPWCQEPQSPSPLHGSEWKQIDLSLSVGVFICVFGSKNNYLYVQTYGVGSKCINFYLRWFIDAGNVYSYVYRLYKQGRVSQAALLDAEGSPRQKQAKAKFDADKRAQTPQVRTMRAQNEKPSPQTCKTEHIQRCLTCNDIQR